MITRIVFREDVDPREWDAFVMEHDGGWFWHTSGWIDYTLACRAGSVDYSLLCCGDEGIFGIAPLVRDPDGRFQFHGEPGPRPLARREPARLWEAVTLICPGSPCAFREQAAISAVPSGWHAGRSWETFVVDLTIAEAERWRLVRRSYHSLIHRAEERYEIRVSTDAMDAQTCHDLHREAAGRETRGQRTWDLMGEWLASGSAYVVMAVDRETRAVEGYAYIIAYKALAYYASGATRQPNIAHALEWVAMKEAVSRGLQHYEVGWDVRPGEEHDQKGLGIARFKAGWGGARWPMVTMERGE